MILVDSSVWIAILRRQQTPATDKFKALARTETILLGDLILLEILQGARDDRHAAALERELRYFSMVPLLDAALPRLAARHVRTLRAMGITIRKTVDVVIGTFCIEHGHQLLHNDRDFEPMAAHLGLMVV